MKSKWAGFLAKNPAQRSTTSICLSINDPWFIAQSEQGRQDFIAIFCKALEKENVAFDIKSYRDAPAGLRIWGGATIEASDLEALTPWLDWAYEHCKNQTSNAKAA